MGLATLNVWIHDKQDPCKINDGFWYVTVTYCNGEIVEWCGETYRGLDAKCGHAEFTLPPGCYTVWGYQVFLIPNPGKFPIYIPTFFTERAIVIVNCDEVGCVHLYTPTIWLWFVGASRAARYLAESGQLPADKVERFVAASDDLRRDIQQTAGDAAHERLVEQLTEYLKKNPPK
jgi:hypothetical protein